MKGGFGLSPRRNQAQVGGGRCLVSAQTRYLNFSVHKNSLLDVNFAPDGFRELSDLPGRLCLAQTRPMHHDVAPLPNDRVRAFELWEGWHGYDRRKYCELLEEAFEPFEHYARPAAVPGGDKEGES